MILTTAIPILGLTIACSDETHNLSAGTPIAHPTDSPLLGDVTHFDPVARYPEIVKYAGSNLQLSSISFNFVRSDGTMDLTAKYGPHVYYSFFQPMGAPPPDAPPLGAGGKLNEKWFQPVDVNVTAPDNPGENPRVSRYEGKPTNSILQAIPTPSCPLRKLWSAAMEKGAPENAVATIYYDEGAYSFRINDTSVSLDFNYQCQYTGGIGLTPEPTETPLNEVTP